MTSLEAIKLRAVLRSSEVIGQLTAMMIKSQVSTMAKINPIWHCGTKDLLLDRVLMSTRQIGVVIHPQY